MDFGQNLYNLVVTNAQPVVLGGIVIVGIYLLAKHKLAEFIGLLVVGIIAVGFVFNSSGTKDVFLNIYNRILANGGSGGTAGLYMTYVRMLVPWF